MRRITAAIGALTLTAGVLLGMTGTASAQVESMPPRMCVGSSLELFDATALCIADRSHFPVFGIIGR